MNIKLKLNLKSQNVSGFTLLETLIATGIASIIITSALSVVASIYFSQKRVKFSHDFFAEGRFLMERISQVARNNTIDYDRYFVEMGPNTAGCALFSADRVPGGSPLTNDRNNRLSLGYGNIFYWDTNDDDRPDRNLGGMELNGLTVDSCTFAMRPDGLFDYDGAGVNPAEPIRDLYLINSGLNTRIHIAHEPGPDFKVTMSRQLGADTDNDGRADTWGPFDANNDGDIEANDLDIDIRWSGSECQLFVNADANASYGGTDEIFPVMGDAGTESTCDQAHLVEDISPVALQVNNLDFLLSPHVDPYLAFRNTPAQVHPQAYVFMDLSLRNPDRYGFEVDSVPTLDFQTMVSSRVFGNIRR